jgi:ligand-binding sensor domain-containing protein
MSTNVNSRKLAESSTSVHFAAWVLVAIAALTDMAAQADHNSATPMRFTHVSLEQGLSQATVTTILQDSTGYMWFGTENGLNRYDGYNILRYQRSRQQPQGLTSDFIWAVAEDAERNLWIATDGGGAVVWNRSRDTFTSYRHDSADPGSLATNHLRTVALDSQGAVWLGTRDRGLDRLDPRTGEITHFRHDPNNLASLGHDSVYVAYQDGSGQLWIGTDGGISRLHQANGEFIRYQHDPADPTSLSSNLIRAIYEDRQGTLWIGTEDGGLNQLDPVSGRFVRYQHDSTDAFSISDDHVRVILEDSDNRLWVGTEYGLNLLERDNGRFTHYLHEDADPTSLSDNYIMSLFEDRSGMLWVGTRSGGLNKWNPRSWSFGHSKAEGLGNSNITAFADDANGRVWIGTFGSGLGLVDEHRDGSHAPALYQQASDGGTGLTDDRIMALLRDHEGMLWIGTMTGGVNVLNPDTGKIRVFRHDPADPASLSDDGVMTLYEDRHGNVWVGTFGGGLSLYDRKSGAFTRFAHDAADPAALANARVTAIAEDLSGAIWVGTDGGGLHLIDGERRIVQRFRHDPNDPTTLSADTIYALHVDRAGNVWLGTPGGGLDRVIGSSRRPAQIRFRNLSEVDGLPNNVIYGIRSDQSGNLWMSTNAGVTRFDPGTGQFKAFHRSHGLQGEEFNFGAHHKGANGKLYFGGANGFNAFFPDRIEESTHTPAVVLTSFKKLNEPTKTSVPYDLLDTVALEYNDDVVEFEFAALDFTASEENRYAYMLEGFDQDWVELGTRNRVTYTNLDDGDYVFRVRAANSDAVWNEDALNIALRVQPAPWETWWAYAMYIGLAALIIVWIWRSQHRKRVREIQYSRRLETEVRERTDEIAQRNNELSVLNDKLMEASLTDPLTGLRNRRFVFEQVAKDVDLVQRQHFDTLHGVEKNEVVDLVFMMVDLDHFKPVNDEYGHAAGDEMLLQVRDVLLSACRSMPQLRFRGPMGWRRISRHCTTHECAGGRGPGRTDTVSPRAENLPAR